jgi:putative ABC transport system substrate-binding protein
MKRRDFITLLGGAAAAWPLSARAQQAGLPVIGFLHAGSPGPNAEFVAALRRGLSEAGFVEGRNITIEYRWAEGQFNRLPEMAADLVRRHVAVIATPLSTQATLAAKAATTTIPIVFGSGADPVALGFVSSFSRPGGNVTGIGIMTAALAAKRLGIFHEMLPNAVHIAVLGNSHNALTEITVKDLLATVPMLGMRAEVLYAGTTSELDSAFATMAQKHIEAVLIAPDEFFTSRLEQLAALSLRHALPSNYSIREFVRVGGLMSYGPNFTNAYFETGRYVGKVLKGEKPADLPVVQPTEFQLAINLKTARSLGLEVPQTLLAIADEVIE